MKVIETQNLPNGIVFEVIEANNPVAVESFENRFEVVINVENKRILPRSKERYHTVESDETKYSLNGVMVDPITWWELHICDKTLEECHTDILSYMSMYNEGQDVTQELKKTYNIRRKRPNLVIFEM